jgi:soluble lytic murein transglycosylase-like protein
LHDPEAVSHVGARGIAQFMPGTWTEVSGQLGFTASPHSARHAIPAGAHYMRRLFGGWTSERPLEDQKRLAEASYNAGFGGVLGAQRRCGEAIRYAGIEPCLPDETRTYVQRIQHWYRLKRRQ